MNNRTFLNLTRAAPVALVLAWALTAGAPNASAAAVIDFVDPGSNSLEDGNRSYLIDNVNNGDANTLDVGDDIRAHIRINFIEPPNEQDFLGDANGNRAHDAGENNEFTGVVQVRIVSKTPLGGGAYRFDFGPSPTFGDYMGDSADYGADSPGAIGVFYDDFSNNFDVDGANTGPGSAPGPLPGRIQAEGAIETATDGTRWVTLGFTGAEGEGYFAIAPSDDLDDLANTSQNQSAVTIYFALNRLNNAVGEVADQLALAPLSSTVATPTGPEFMTGEFIGQAGIHGRRGFVSEFDVRGDADIEFFVIPLPAAAWMGLTLLGAAALGRRRLIGL